MALSRVGIVLLGLFGAIGAGLQFGDQKFGSLLSRAYQKPSFASYKPSLGEKSSSNPTLVSHNHRIELFDLTQRLHFIPVSQ